MSLFMGKGNGRAGMSKAVELFCLGIAREAGVKASNQPFHLFSKYIDQRRRAEYESVALLQSRGMHFQQSGNNCGAVVVNLYLQGVSDPDDGDVVQDRCYDVKTVGQRTDRYSLSAHVRAADKIEDVRAEDDRKARICVKFAQVDKRIADGANEALQLLDAVGFVHQTLHQR